MLRPLVAASVSLLLALPAAAQAPLKVGDRLPPIVLEGLAQTEASSFADFYGRTVLLEFFAHWCGPCASSVPHLNELQEQFGARGFSIVAVTSEAAKKTEPWIEKHGVRYPYGYDPKRELMTLFNVQGIPFGALVDPFGTVVWTGHPMSLKEDVIEGALAGALEKPTWQWAPELQPLAQALQREEFGKAMELARTLQSGDDLDLVALVRGRYQPLVERFGKLVDEKEWSRALDLGARLETGLAGLPERDALVARLQTIRADEEIMREVNGNARIAALEGRAMKLRDQAEAETLRADVAAFLKEQSGTKLEKRAQALLDAIDRALERARGKKG